MHGAMIMAVVAVLILSIAAWTPMASAQSHRNNHNHNHEDHEGMSYIISATGIATNIKSRTGAESSMIVYVETTRANDKAVSFKTVEGELKVGDDSYSIIGGKASLAVKSGRLSITMMLEDHNGKVQLVRMTASLTDPLPHEDGEEAEISFKVAKVLRFWKLDMKGEMTQAS